MACFDEFVFEPMQAFAIDQTSGPTRGFQHINHRTDRA